MSIQPINQIGGLPEHGRIRTGVKSGKFAKAIDTFRFTSKDRAALEHLAKIYGGEVRPWHDAKANPPNQFEVISDSNVITVGVQPNQVHAAYELWASGGLQRQCDGEAMTTWDYDGEDSHKTEGLPCACFAQGVLECKPKTRLQLIFPGIPFAGTWRYESSGQHALHTLPSMMQLIEQLQTHTGGLMLVEMHIVDQERVKGRQKKKWKIVEVRTTVTVDQMLGGDSAYRPALSASEVQQPALEASPPQTPPVAPAAAKPIVGDDDEPMDDDDIVDAEIVEDVPDHPELLDRATAMQMARESGGTLTARKVDGGWTVT